MGRQPVGEKTIIERETKGAVTILRTKQTEIIEPEDVQCLQDELREWVEDQTGEFKVLLNLEETIYLNSSALGALMVLEVKVRRRGGEIGVCGLRESIADAFRITKLDHLFEVFESEEEALAKWGS